MKHQFARSACSAILMPALLVLAGGCSTQPVASSSAPQAQTPSEVNAKTTESTAAVETKAVESNVIEPKAMEALQKMGGFLRTLKAYEVSFKMSKDEVLDSGQKIMVDGASELNTATLKS